MESLATSGGIGQTMQASWRFSSPKITFLDLGRKAKKTAEVASEQLDTGYRWTSRVGKQWDDRLASIGAIGKYSSIYRNATKKPELTRPRSERWKTGFL